MQAPKPTGGPVPIPGQINPPRKWAQYRLPESKGGQRAVQAPAGYPGAKPDYSRPVPQAVRPTPTKTTPRIFLEGQKYSGANTAYNSAKGSLKGFVRNPQSPTGWAFMDDLGRMAFSRTPQKGERIISAQQIQKVNPNFYKQNGKIAPKPVTKPAAPAQPAGAVAPWLVGFTGGNGWAQTVDGGWYNTEDGRYWKTGSGIPGGGTSTSNINSQQQAIYENLIKMFEGLRS